MQLATRQITSESVSSITWGHCFFGIELGGYVQCLSPLRLLINQISLARWCGGLVLGPDVVSNSQYNLWQRPFTPQDLCVCLSRGELSEVSSEVFFSSDIDLESLSGT